MGNVCLIREVGERPEDDLLKECPQILKKDIREFSLFTLIGLLVISIPLMIIIMIVLFVLFAVSLISYVFMTSWFILYGLILISKRVDKDLYKNNCNFAG